MEAAPPDGESLERDGIATVVAHIHPHHVARSASPRHWASAPRTPNRARTLQPFPPLSHSGPGLTLVRSALDDVRSQGGIKVVPICPFVKAWMLKNPKYPDLLYGT